MIRRLTGLAAGVSLVALSASVALAAAPAVATGQGSSVSAVAQAADYVSGRAHGLAVSTLAKQHGALVSAAAKANGFGHAAGKPTTGAPTEPGRLKG